MVEVAALTSGGKVPSSRFRIRQHIEPLRALGFQVREYIPRVSKYAPVPIWPERVSVRFAPHFYLWQGIKLASRFPGLVGSWRSRITWVERELLPGRLTVEPLLKDPVIFDVDDAIWLASPCARTAAASIAERATIVLAGNEYLANWFSAHARDVRVLPTAIDTDRFIPAPAPPPTDRFVIGWTGSAASLPYLEAIETPLRMFLSCIPEAELLVVADRMPAFGNLPADRVRFIPWSEAVEARVLQEIQVGIMPLPDDEWTRGKCGFKMLQYMACAIPVVVSPVGMNAEILAMDQVGWGAYSDADWYELLSLVYQNPTQALQMGRAGRALVEEHFSRGVISRRIGEIFREVCP